MFEKKKKAGVGPFFNTVAFLFANMGEHFSTFPWLTLTLTGGRHSTVDPSVHTILQPRVRSSSTIPMLFQSV